MWLLEMSPCLGDPPIEMAVPLYLKILALLFLADPFLTFLVKKIGGLLSLLL